jgi:hypothetical protein
VTATCSCLVVGSRVNHHCNLGVLTPWSLSGAPSSLQPSGLVWSDIKDRVWEKRRPLLHGKLCSEDGVKVTGARGDEYCLFGKNLTYLV